MATTLLAAVLLLAGCSARDIDATYGKLRGSPGEASVNGTAVLAQMFEQAGRRVVTKKHLSPRTSDFSTIVWAPDDFSVPAQPVRDFLERWLADGVGRTVIYIGRDYDAAPDYWDQALATAPPEQVSETIRRRAAAHAAHDSARAVMPVDESGPWFRVRRDGVKRHIGRPEGPQARLHGPWCDDGDIVASQVDIHLEGRLEPQPQAPPETDFSTPTEIEPLLASGNDLLAWRIRHQGWNDGQIIVVANGSFLLNLPLVEKEHRKLAAQLVAECPASSRTLFLESERGGPPVYTTEPGHESRSGFELFTVWPLNALLLQLVALGLVFLFSRVRIFGRPHELPTAATTDFGRHITALGELLMRTQDQQYARERLAFYQEKVRPPAKGRT